MSESDHTDDRDQAVQEAAEHADRAAEERQEMRRTASLAEATDDSHRAEKLSREAEAHKSEAYAEEDASAERAP